MLAFAHLFLLLDGGVPIIHAIVCVCVCCCCFVVVVLFCILAVTSMTCTAGLPPVFGCLQPIYHNSLLLCLGFFFSFWLCSSYILCVCFTPACELVGCAMCNRDGSCATCLSDWGLLPAAGICYQPCPTGYYLVAGVCQSKYDPILRVRMCACVHVCMCACVVIVIFISFLFFPFVF